MRNKWNIKNEKYLTKFQLKILEGRDYMKDLGVDGRSGLIKGYGKVIRCEDSTGGLRILDAA
jgi:hypothetical protein